MAEDFVPIDVASVIANDCLGHKVSIRMDAVTHMGLSRPAVVQMVTGSLATEAVRQLSGGRNLPEGKYVVRLQIEPVDHEGLPYA